MQFVVPQFIDVETKIIGPISARQFILVIIGGGLMFLEYRYLALAFAVVFMLLTGTFFGVVAFGKINGQAMHYFLLNLIDTLRRPRLKFWQRVLYSKEVEKDKEEQIVTPIPKAPVTQSRLAAMSLMVDTGGAYKPEEQSNVPVVPTSQPQTQDQQQAQR